MPTLPVTIRPLPLRLLDDDLEVAAVDGPEVGDDGTLVGLVRSPDAVTVVRRIDPQSPPAAAWQAFYAEDGHALDLPGVLVGVLAPLANAGVEVFVLSTIDRDLVLVPVERVGDAADALRLAGHTVAPLS